MHLPTICLPSKIVTRMPACHTQRDLKYVKEWGEELMFNSLLTVVDVLQELAGLRDRHLQQLLLP